VSPPDPTAGYKKLLVYAVPLPTTTTKESYAAWGSLWLPWERRGDFMRAVQRVRDETGHHGSIASAAHGTASESFALALIDEFFRRRWLAFRALVAPVKTAFSPPGWPFARLIGQRLSTLPGGLEGRELRLRVDKSPLWRAVVKEADQLVFGRLIAPASFQHSVRAARSSEGLELAQLLTGLIVDDWDKLSHSPHRRRLSARAAENLGWSDLAGDTFDSEWKLNIALAQAPEQLADGTQRTVQLRLPLVD
jgi:hypothetical protein